VLDMDPSLRAPPSKAVTPFLKVDVLMTTVYFFV
jgi:hypothetical protein